MHESSVEPGKQHRVLIIEDEPPTIDGYCSGIEEHPRLTLAGICKTSEQALDALRNIQFDVVIFDLGLYKVPQWSLLDHYLSSKKPFKTLIVSHRDEMVDGFRAIKKGAAGFVPKIREVQVILNSAIRVVEGEVVISSRLFDALLACNKQRTDLQSQVLQLMQDGWQLPDIADSLSKSYSVTHGRATNLRKEFGFDSLSEFQNWLLQTQPFS